jgi:membrane-associated HD superfamily phosphohydrolase
LPEKVLDFIPQHHGTTRISFFFDKAIKQAAARKNPKDVINEEDFRYPGPKPQTKETGIVMLADSVEASTRSLAEMTPQRLETGIENMIKQRFVEGELDECDLTLRDLSKIKDAFLQMLIGIHHQRIVYPEPEKVIVPEIRMVEPVAIAEQPKPEPVPAALPPPEPPVSVAEQAPSADASGLSQ